MSFKKIIVVIVSMIVLIPIVYVGILIFMFSAKVSNTDFLGKCKYTTTHYPVPSFLREVTIKYGVETSYAPKGSANPCDSTIGWFLTFEEYQTYFKNKLISIPANMEFIVIDYFQTDPREHFDGPQIDTYLVVRDRNGEESLLNVDVLSWRGENRRHFAGYYKNGRRIGDTNPEPLRDPESAQRIILP